MGDLLRVHSFESSSRSNGPGRRAVLWLQGCTLGCPGCFNTETHTKDGGETLPVEAVFAQIQSVESVVQGLTITGGEPLQQPWPLLQLVMAIKEQTRLSVLLFTGFSNDELLRQAAWPEIAEHVDVVIAGRYDRSRRVASGLMGSRNKKATFLTDRYSQVDLDQVPPAEVIIGSDGELMLTGIDPLKWGV